MLECWFNNQSKQYWSTRPKMLALIWQTMLILPCNLYHGCYLANWNRFAQVEVDFSFALVANICKYLKRPAADSWVLPVCLPHRAWYAPTDVISPEKLQTTDQIFSSHPQTSNFNLRRRSANQKAETSISYFHHCNRIQILAKGQIKT